MAYFLQPWRHESGPGHGQDDLRTPQDQHDDHQSQASPCRDALFWIHHGGGVATGSGAHDEGCSKTCHHGVAFAAFGRTSWAPRAAKQSPRPSRSTRQSPTSSTPACAWFLSHLWRGVMRFVTHHCLRTTHHGALFAAPGTTIWVLRAARRSARPSRSTPRSPTSGEPVFAWFLFHQGGS